MMIKMRMEIILSPFYHDLLLPDDDNGGKRVLIIKRAMDIKGIIKKR